MRFNIRWWLAMGVGLVAGPPTPAQPLSASKQTKTLLTGRQESRFSVVPPITKRSDRLSTARANLLTNPPEVDNHLKVDQFGYLPLAKKGSRYQQSPNGL